jgi:hypothetical protein
VFLFFITTTGFTISEHYCGNKLISVTINAHAKSCCDNNTCSCCHNKTEHFQIKDVFVSAIILLDLNISFLPDLKFLPHTYSNINTELEILESFCPYKDSHPPLKIETILSRLQRYLL